MDTRTHTMKAAPWGVVLAIALLVAACGGGGDSASNTSTTSSSKSTNSSTTEAPVVANVALAGTPSASVTVGSSFMFQPTVTAGGGTMTFFAQGLPAWMTFDSDTGVLTGTPTAANVGTTSAITITASNGSSSAAIGPFEVAVNAAPSATGSAALSWVAPTENADGTPITDLSGYHIYYGTSEGALSTTVTVSSATTTTYTVNDLPAGSTYYFSVVAFNSDGMDSADSNIESKTI